MLFPFTKNRKKGKFLFFSKKEPSPFFSLLFNIIDEKVLYLIIKHEAKKVLPSFFLFGLFSARKKYYT
jgi:hypothetical protein